MVLAPIFGLSKPILVVITCGIGPLEVQALIVLILLLRLLTAASPWLAKPDLLVLVATILGLLGLMPTVITCGVGFLEVQAMIMLIRLFRQVMVAMS